MPRADDLASGIKGAGSAFLSAPVSLARRTGRRIWRLAFRVVLGDNNVMNYTGKVKNGVVALPANVHLPWRCCGGHAFGTHPGERSVSSGGGQGRQTASTLAQGLPLNHGHYVSGEPKKS